MDRIMNCSARITKQVGQLCDGDVIKSTLLDAEFFPFDTDLCLEGWCSILVPKKNFKLSTRIIQK